MRCNNVRIEIVNSAPNSTITSVVWEQIEPTYASINDKNFVMFRDELTNVVLNSLSVLKLRMSAFNYISPTQSVKMKVTISNSVGDVASDYAEFFLNESPRVGTNSLTLNTLGATPSSFSTGYSIALSNWYDSLDDTTQKLDFKVFYKNGTKRMLIADVLNEETINVPFPMLSKGTGASTTMQLCVGAVDANDAHSFLCNDLSSVLLNYTESALPGQLTTMAGYDLTVVTNILQIAVSFDNIYEEQRRAGSAPFLCTQDYHCHDNGVCRCDNGVPHCECSNGYSGYFCEFKNEVAVAASELSTSAINGLHSLYGSKSVLSADEVEVVLTVVSSALKTPDLAPFESYGNAFELLNKSAYASE